MDSSMKANSEELVVFVSVIESGSIKAASKNLSIAPSGVSRTLSRLEEKFGTTLLNRTTRRMHLTEEGAVFLEDAKDILKRIGDFEERFTSRLMAPSGKLRVTAATAFMLHVIVPRIDEFRHLCPEIRLQLNTSELNVDLLAENTDIAIRIGTLDDSTLRARPLGASRSLVVASPDYIAMHGKPETVTALADHTLLGHTEPDCLNVWPIRHEGGNGLQISPALCASSEETIRQLTLQGIGIACLPDYMTVQDVASGRLVKVLPDMQVDSLQPVHAVYYRNGKLSVRTRCFLDFLQIATRDMLIPPA
jgi:DNA-binding transcriptional LysR family regulator